MLAASKTERTGFIKEEVLSKTTVVILELPANDHKNIEVQINIIDKNLTMNAFSESTKSDNMLTVFIRFASIAIHQSCLNNTCLNLENSSSTLPVPSATHDKAWSATNTGS
jgi:hypothetical protein